MGRIVYIDGNFVAADEAKISVFDRGFLFADAVYEVSAVVNGRLVDNARHLERLGQSLLKLSIRLPMPLEDIEAAQQRLIAENQLVEGALYLQVTRGVTERDFAIAANLSPTLVMFTQAKQLIDSPTARDGIRVQSTPDTRWRRCDIKTIQLLTASLAKQEALDAGLDDAWFVADGFVTEGTASNVFVVNADGTLITRELSSKILSGITRQAILEIADRHQMTIDQRPFTLEEAYGAQEAFISSATAMIIPVIEVDGHAIGDGRPGQITQQIRAAYLALLVTERL